ncbi:MAG: NADH-quinone oxidoreductase subunit 11 [bacterium]|nr:NADH-quinone oxidoreductase subunit 11 [bacterium]
MLPPDIQYNHLAVPNLAWYLNLGVIVFLIGLYGAMTRRNAIAILMCLEMMLSGINIMFATMAEKWGVTFTLQSFRLASNVPTPIGQIFVVFIITVAAAEAAIGLALIIAMYRHFRSVQVEEINLLRW